MNRILLFFIALAACTLQASAQTKYKEIVPDTAKVRYIRREKPEDAYIFAQREKRNIIWVNEDITTHIIMPENIKLVDISTNKVFGNQCADNIVRIKPSGRMYNNELAGTITIIGERHIAQYNVVYTNAPSRANAIYNIDYADMQAYNNPDVCHRVIWQHTHGQYIQALENLIISQHLHMASKLSLITSMP